MSQVAPEIAEAAHTVATAQQHLENASTKLASASEEYGQVQQRVVSLNAKRDDIILRRQRGDQRPNDAAELALVDADRQGLAPILAEAQAAMDAARGPVQQAKRELDLSKENLQIIEGRLTMAALVEHATQLGDLLSATIKRLDDLHSRVGGGRLPWAPPRDLYLALHRRAAQYGLL
jgi:chromosome segregation ATPase